jgi:hypothetical protein
MPTSLYLDIKKETCKGLFPVYSVFMKLNRWLEQSEQQELTRQQRDIQLLY